MRMEWKREAVTADLMAALGAGPVLLHERSRRHGARKFLAARRAADGRFYVEQRGERRALAVCDVTLIDGVPQVHQFICEGDA